MAALLVAMSAMAVVMSMVLPAWRTLAQREKEAELVWRGDQYARAIARYQAARGAYPPSVDVLVTEKFLRRKYKDPITNDDFQVVRLGEAIPGQAQAGPQRQPGQPAGTGFNRVTREGRIGGSGGGPIIGVVSKSTGTSLRVINGKNKYSEMPFTATDATLQGGAGGRGGASVPGGVGGRGVPGMGGRGGTATPGGAPRGGSPGRGQPMPGGGQRLQLPGAQGR